MSDMPGFQRSKVNPGPYGVVAGREGDSNDAMKTDVEMLKTTVEQLQQQFDALHQGYLELLKKVEDKLGKK